MYTAYNLMVHGMAQNSLVLGLTLPVIKPMPWLFFQPSIEVINPVGPPQDDLRAWSSRTRRHTCPRGSRARTWSCWRRSSTRSRSRRSKARPQKAGSKSQRARGSCRLFAPERNRIQSGKSFRRTGSWPARAQSVIWGRRGSVPGRNSRSPFGKSRQSLGLPKISAKKRRKTWPTRNKKLSNDFFAFSSIHNFNIRLPSISISKLKPSRRGFFFHHHCYRLAWTVSHDVSHNNCGPECSCCFKRTLTRSQQRDNQFKTWIKISRPFDHFHHSEEKSGSERSSNEHQLQNQECGSFSRSKLETEPVVKRSKVKLELVAAAFCFHVAVPAFFRPWSCDSGPVLVS